jgi:hypothetical protein
MKATICLVAGIVAFSRLHAQAPAAPTGPDPFADPSAVGVPTPAAPEAQPNQNLSVRYEVFSLDLATAAALQRENPGDATLYLRLVAMVEKKEAIQESMHVIRCVQGQKSMSENTAELIYATEYEPPELPNTVGVSIEPPKSPTATDNPATLPDTTKLENAPSLSVFNGIQTPATPTAYQTRNTGITIEMEASVDPDTGKVQLISSFDNVRHVGVTEQGTGLSKTTMPEFEVQKLMGSATVTPGKPFLLGTMNRPPVSKVDADSANRIWFAFVTVDSVKP